MRAFAVRSFGEAPAIHDLPISAEDGAFLIRVRYAGVNPIDYKLLEKLTATSTYPFIIGVDFAGVVERVPTGESDFRAGGLRHGTNSRRIRRVHRSRTRR
jgi:NADPH:quinone reductase